MRTRITLTTMGCLALLPVVWRGVEVPRQDHIAADSYDNALAVTVIGLYKTEVIRQAGIWHGLDDVEYATLEWVAWYNTQRLLEALGYLPPAKYEEQYHGASAKHAPEVALTQPRLRKTRVDSERYSTGTVAPRDRCYVQSH